jgi:hypothetical protein
MPAYIFDPIISPPLRRIVAGILLGRGRDFAQDSRTLVSELKPPLRRLNAPPTLPPGGVAVLANHYVGPDFHAWWLAFAISSSLDAQVKWVVTNEWGYPDLLRRTMVTPATRLFLQRAALSYGFFLMPPMPPRPQEVEARASAVKRILRFVAQSKDPILGVAPEGADAPTLALGPPPAGTGRFLIQLARHRMRFLPVAVYQEDKALCIRFGEVFSIDRDGQREASDRAADLSMRAIARLLPESLQGYYA